MAQRPKPQVRAAILAAAARELAEVGAARATLGAIARRAGTSIGNLYKYFPSRGALFAEAIPPGLERRLGELLRARVRALSTEREVGRLAGGHPYRRASDELLGFSLTHRHEVLFLLRHAAGARRGSFSDEVERELVTLAIAYARGAYPAFRPSGSSRRTLGRIYRGFLGSLAAILSEESSEGAARRASDELTAYHLAGMRALFTLGEPRSAS